MGPPSHRLTTNMRGHGGQVQSGCLTLPCRRRHLWQLVHEDEAFQLSLVGLVLPHLGSGTTVLKMNCLKYLKFILSTSSQT